MATAAYLEHLTEADIALLGTTAGTAGIRDPAGLLRDLRQNPNQLDSILRSSQLFSMLFGSDQAETFFRASPFLVFAVLLARASSELQEVGFLEERIGPGRRVPIFDLANVRDFADEPLRRLFLAELLASYTRVASGVVWMQTRAGWRRRRFSELDPLRLMELLDIVPEHERWDVYRRLGDLSLFLTGVFPDHVDAHLLSSIQRERLRRRLQRQQSEVDMPAAQRAEPSDNVALLEQVGRHAYRLAWKGTGSQSGPLQEVTEGFDEARRILSFLTERYIFPLRHTWFSMPES